MRRSLAVVALFATAALSLSACGNLSQSLGWDKRTPDEFTVVSRAPLTLPPEYKLTPPRPGAERPETGSARDEAKRTLLTGSKVSANRDLEASSQGQLALLRKVGADQVEPNIRSVIDQETSIFAVEDQTLTEKLMFWTGAPETEYGTVIDAEKEAARLREAQALGKPVDGANAPSIARKPKGLLEGTFN